jgi:rhodanese-related sulfurtransferase
MAESSHSSRSPGEPLTRNYRAIVADAEARVQTLSPADVAELLNDSGHLIVDIREPRELERGGTIPGAFRAPRGMLEFWVDPESPYFKPALDDGRKLVLFCGGGWRSALAAASLVDMGRDDVAHLGGGFAAWKSAGLPVEEVAPR